MLLLSIAPVARRKNPPVNRANVNLPVGETTLAARRENGMPDATQIGPA
jgi:hypothetical protein